MDEIKVVQMNQAIVANSSPNRIRIALSQNGADAKLLAMRSAVEDENVIVVKQSFFYKIKRKIASAIQNVEYKRKYCIDKVVTFSYYTVGMDLSKDEIVRNADIIQLHWICGSFISVENLSKLINLNKPMVWVCHDNWPFTGGCHVRLGCEKYKHGCGECPQLNSHEKRDWTYRLLDKKREVMKGANITFVSPSTWMDNNVAASSLASAKKHVVIPNPIDTNKFKKLEESKLRKKLNIDDNTIVLLFGATRATGNPNKGYYYLREAIAILEGKYGNTDKMELVIFGSDGKDIDTVSQMRTHYLGYLSEEEMVEAYNCADIYLVPTLEDSFNNTVAESMACETPVVAFATGGITDIIDHKKNGYLANYKDSKDLVNGIEWICNSESELIRKNSRNKIIKNFSFDIVAEKYMSLYQELLK